jgi:hypothetical protein
MNPRSLMFANADPAMQFSVGNDYEIFASVICFSMAEVNQIY